MSVEYINGQYYNVPEDLTRNDYIQKIWKGYIPPLNAPSAAPAPQAPSEAKSMYGDPFGTAMSGSQQNTLQPYLNKQNANAYRALNGGLLGYSPQPMTAGNATGGATMASGAQGGMPAGLLAGAGGQLAQTGQLDPLQLALQNRSWMKGAS